MNKVMDGLDEKGAARLQDILDHVLVGGSVEKVFDDCIRTWNAARLAEEEKRLLHSFP